MPPFGDYGKSGKPVPKCPYHDKSLATCTCQYAREWRKVPSLDDLLARVTKENIHSAMEL